MPDVVKRGYMPSDDKEFIDQIEKLREAGEVLYYLINRGYQIKPASTFVGNHHLLSERQRLALARSISLKDSIEERVAKEVHELKDSVVYIDTFNTVITLEIAFSGSTLLYCMDGTIRDLAGLRGTYRIIDKTDMAVEAIRKVLEAEGVKEAHFLIDAPISNSGRLRSKIEDMFIGSYVNAICEVINDVDKNLYEKERVITSDAIILDNCRSWYNLTGKAIQTEIGYYPFVRIL
ncbi:MAG: DUF434 domain-containing protein [Lachnospiraceae bacterium]|nr:DUF434 domain-containing protein [Lachnospiraceae bacterium]